MRTITAIVGPTASGKSAVALGLAEATGGEIIACDSVQVYRGFDVGSAKATRADRSRTPHHLIDVADWNTPFDAQTYCAHAEAALADIRARGRVPIVCGGTGLYLRALRYGLMPTPTADPALRRSLEESEAAAPGSALAELRRVDPESAAQIHPANRVRILRALEIWRQTGQPASALRSQHGFRVERVAMRVVVLEWEPAELKARIAVRVGSMLGEGLLDEVEGLLRGGVRPDCRPMGSIGYREACAVVTGVAPREGLESRIVASTWAYARRQRTWMRREPAVEYVEVKRLELVAADLIDGDRSA